MDTAALEKFWGKSAYSSLTNKEISPEMLGMDASRAKAAEKKKAEKAAKLAASIAEDEQDAHIEALTEYDALTEAGAAPARGYAGDVQVNNWTMRYVGKELLTDTNFVLTAGRRYGLIGKNGIGKTTLVRVTAATQTRAACRCCCRCPRPFPPPCPAGTHTQRRKLFFKQNTKKNKTTNNKHKTRPPPPRCTCTHR